MDTHFPFPNDPEKWQTAYTADDAYYNEGSISSTASLLGSASLITVLLYSAVFLFAQLFLKFHLFNLDPGFAATLDGSQVTESLREAFQNQEWILSDQASITVLRAGSKWTIRDANIQYTIQTRGQTLSVDGERNGIMFLLRNLHIKNYLFQLDPGMIETLDASRISEPLREAFQKEGITLDANAAIVVKEAGSQWTILDPNRHFLIRNDRQSLKVFEKQQGLIILGVCMFICLTVLQVFKRVGKSAYRTAKQFFREFYLPPEMVKPADVIKYRISSRIKLPMPFSEWFSSFSQFKYILVQNGQFLKNDEWPAWLAQNIGGPILLIVFDGSALYIERGNRFSRVVGPGVSYLERYETIKYALDLRTKIKTDKIEVWTKDGIVVKLTIQIEYRIGDPKNTKSHLIFPFDPEAVKKAVERYALRWQDPTKEPSEFTWEDAVWGQVTGIVPAYIGSRFLDDLLVADRKGGQILAPDAADEIFNRINDSTNTFGVFVTDFQIVSIELPQEVMHHYVKYWEAERQSLATMIDGKAKAFNIRVHEKVRADAQKDLILAIADGLKKNDKRLTEALLLSLSEVLDHGLSDPYMRSYTAKETLDTLEKLKNMLE
jgi:regulator of protease activity HflC (stomatin/prohibitin superfamily)